MIDFRRSSRFIPPPFLQRMSYVPLSVGLFITATLGFCGYLGVAGYGRYSLENRLRPELLRQAYRFADINHDHFVSPPELRTLGIDLYVLEPEESVPRGDLRERIRSTDLASLRDYIVQHGSRLPEGCDEYFGFPCENPYFPDLENFARKK